MTKLPVTNLPVTNMAVDILLDAHAGTAEGPVWDERRQQLVWTDIPGESIHFTDLSSGKDASVDVGTRVGCVVPRTNGGFAMGACQEFLLCGPDDLSHPEERVHITDESLVRVNDGKCDPAGRFFAGTAANDGRWGTDTMASSIALLQSARERRVITLANEDRTHALR